ncbi:MAG TPA: DUF2147 domain-containing protein [Sphingobacterium sp.]|nr:DUF2147 domain-containing protein [Sphingobacterium sp.]
MKKIYYTLIALFITAVAFGQSSNNIVGKWTTIDDETGQAKSVVEIIQKPDGKYYGKIDKLLMKPENSNCVNCKDDRKNKPLTGLEIIRGLSKEGKEFTGGTIVDPKTGKVYKCTITRNGDKLQVRGYIGFSLIGRTQTWNIVK